MIARPVELVDPPSLDLAMDKVLGESHENLRGPLPSAELDSNRRRREFAARAPANMVNLDLVGISAVTLGAPPFRGNFRSDGEGLLALHVDQHGLAALARTTLTGPGRSEIIDGEPDGVWTSNAAPRAVSRIIITQSPLTAMAHYQQHRDDSVRYIAIGGDSISAQQATALQARIEEVTRAADRSAKRLEVTVTSHHRAHGLKLYGQVETLLREDRLLQVTGILPDNTLGRDWIELARSTRQPELRVDLPAYAASRLGFQEIYRSPDGTKALMASDPTAASPKLLFTRHTDGSWRYENDKTHPLDRGSATDFARSHLQLSFQDFRQDLARFDKEQELRRAPVLAPDTAELNRRGIRPETIDAPCFRGAIRREGNALVYGHQDGVAAVRSVDAVHRIALSDDVANSRARLANAGLWFSNPPAHVDKLVIVETPLVAMAYHQQHPANNTQYVATSNPSLSAQQAQQLVSYVQSLGQRATGRLDVVVATSRGPNGVEHARAIAEAIVLARDGHGPSIRQHEPVVGKDWIESAAKHERSFIRQLPREKGRSLGHGH